jgi:hypothetical protein
MKPIPFRESNINLGSGDNPNTSDMPCAVSVNRGSTGEIPYAISCWRLEPDELEEINRNGGIIYLSNMGWPPPPIVAMVYNPFKMHGFEVLDLENKQ